MKQAAAVSIVTPNFTSKNNNPKSRTLEIIERQLKNENFKKEFNELNIKINNEIILNTLDNDLDSNSKRKREQDKYGYHGKRNYVGLEFAIEFCNRNFIPITKLEKLYLDELYLYAEYYELLSNLNNVNDSELLGCVYNNSIDKKQFAINLKRYITEIIYYIKNNKFSEAIYEIETISSMMTNFEKKYKVKVIK